jgi:hypothetical protein
MRADTAPAAAPTIITAVKATSQPEGSLAAWTDITGLSAPVEIGTYVFKAVILAYAEPATDLQFRFTAPAVTIYIAAGRGLQLDVAASGTAASAMGVYNTPTSPIITGTNDAYAPVTIEGVFVFSAAGTVQLQFHGYTIQSGQDAEIRAGSFLQLHKVP